MHHPSVDEYQQVFGSDPGLRLDLENEGADPCMRLTPIRTLTEASSRMPRV